jgi:hypothetical protein
MQELISFVYAQFRESRKNKANPSACQTGKALPGSGKFRLRKIQAYDY